MLRKILGTTGSRMIIAIIGLMIALCNAKYLGPEGLGTIGLLILGITIILLVNNFIGGTTLVYLIPRENNFKLLIISYCWAVIVIALFALVLQFVHFVPEKYTWDVLLLSLIYSFFSIHLYFLLGNQRIKEHNIITTLQQLIQLTGLILFFIVLKKPSIGIYINMLYISFIFTLITSGFLVFKSVHRFDFSGLRQVFTRILKLGTWVQLAYCIQIMNYRLSYYIIDYFIGRSGLGIFQFGNQLAEGTWVIGKSISIIQYTGISNTHDHEYAKTLTIRLMKITFIASMAILIVLLLIPESVFVFFGKSYSGTSLIIGGLAVGIISNALSMMFSHYFAGLGKPKYNTIGSSVGLVFTLALGFWLISSYGIMGAAITASCSYLSSLLYQSYIFCKMAKPALKDFIITAEDFRLFRIEMNKLLNKNKIDQSGLDENFPV